MDRPKNRNDFRKDLAEMFIESLSEKGLRWNAGWHVDSSGPCNAVTHRPYRGANYILLSMVQMVNGYKDYRWATMVQIMDKKNIYHPGKKWHLKKGSKAVYVEYWWPIDRQTGQSVTWDEKRLLIKSGDRCELDFDLRSTYTPVFNASLIEGIEPMPTIEPNRDVTQDQLIARLCKGMSIEVLLDGKDSAYYSLKEDKIHLPDITMFKDEYEFNSTALHELCHATGHPERLNRDLKNSYGSETYAYEELVAEIGGAFMSPVLRIEPTEAHLNNHKAYVSSWIKAIKDKPDIIINAIKDAESAAKYMDYKAGLISEKEYESIRDTHMSVSRPKKEKSCSLDAPER